MNEWLDAILEAKMEAWAIEKGGEDYEFFRLWSHAVVDFNEHAHTCTTLGAYDCPHCGDCVVCGVL
jgi:hypothetical protein